MSSIQKSWTLDVESGFKSKVAVPKNPKLLKGEAAKVLPRVSPSAFMYQMSLDTHQILENTHEMRVPKKTELLDMGDTSYQRFSIVGVDECMFQPFPSEVYFQKYKPFETYELPLLFRNNDSVPRLIKVTQKDSPYFKIISPHNVGHKVGAGLATIFKIQFIPEDTKDYVHEVQCITEREKFVIPIKCIGSRAILDFPDEVSFSTVPVKHISSKTLYVRNIGSADGKFQLIADGPFKVDPWEGVVCVNEAIQVTVYFCPQTCGNHNRDIRLHLDTGDDIYIKVMGNATDANIRVDKSNVKIDKTYIGLANQRTVTITNTSDFVAKFKWVNLASELEEQMERQKRRMALNVEEEREVEKVLNEGDPTNRDELSIVRQIYKNKQRQLSDDRFLFSDDVMQISPLEGEVWPNSTCDVTVIFKPFSAESYNRIAYLDITGRESRIPLKILGEGIGPKVQYSFDSLDVGHVFVGSTHSYEIVLTNRGDIDAIYAIKSSLSPFGRCFTFNPAEGIITANNDSSYQAIEITFSPPLGLLGPFEEEFETVIDGVHQTKKFYIRGVVIGPTCGFDVNELNFGRIPYGFVQRRTCLLQNTSLVPMKYNLRMLTDGNVDVFSSASDIIGLDVTNPKEFRITPETGTLEPESSVEVSVEVLSLSKHDRRYTTALVVDVDGVGSEVLTLPINGVCIVPQLTVRNNMLHAGRCFLEHPYSVSLILFNESDLPCRFQLLQQPMNSSSPISFQTPTPNGLVEGLTDREVPVVMRARQLGDIESVLYVMVVGSRDPPIAVHIECLGQGPVVNINLPNTELKYGKLPVLKDCSKIVHLSNESPIPAKFHAYMQKAGTSQWRVESGEVGEIPPETFYELNLVANLNDTVKFQDRLVIEVLNSQTHTVNVSATGSGTTIQIYPEIAPYFHAGSVFCKRPIEWEFMATNGGRRIHDLRLRNETHAPSQYSKTQSKDSELLEQNAIFKISPRHMELQPNEQRPFSISGFCENSCQVTETFVCEAIVGKHGAKILLFKFDFSADFVNPFLNILPKQLFFRIDREPGSEICEQSAKFTLQNLTPLPLTMSFCIPKPFYILPPPDSERMQLTMTPADDGGQQMLCRLSSEENMELDMQFNISDKTDQYSIIFDETIPITFDEHPNEESFRIRGEVFFPNLSFDRTTVDFGCIVNDTEVTQIVSMTNTSPMEVKYRWYFLIDGEPITFHPEMEKLMEAFTTIPAIPHKPVPPSSVNKTFGKREPSGLTTDLTGEIDAENPESYSPLKFTHREGTDVDGPQQGESILNTMLNENVGGDEKEDEKFANEVMEKDVHELSFQRSHTLMEGKTPDMGAESVPIPPLGLYRAKTSAQMSVGASMLQHGFKSTFRKRIINENLANLMQNPFGQNEDQVSVEEVFDIRPLFGTLKPGETERMTFTFFGHAFVNGKVKAICEVVGGPKYEIEMKGQASLMKYELDQFEIDFGSFNFDKVGEREFTLINSGDVGFNFSISPNNCPLIDEGFETHQPGCIKVSPVQGLLEGNSKQTIKVQYLHGMPDFFVKSFKLQVAHFPPEVIQIFGEASYPRIAMNLPFNDEENTYRPLAKQVRDMVENERPKTFYPSGTFVPGEDEIQSEVEKIMIKDLLAKKGSFVLSGGRNEKKPRILDYLLDFGHVIMGAIRTKYIKITNASQNPISFNFDCKALSKKGFQIEVDRIRNLPSGETIDLMVGFDPRWANLDFGPVEAHIPLEVVDGLEYYIHCRANVTMPEFFFNQTLVNFEEVKVGEVKLVTIQMVNAKDIPCEWSVVTKSALDTVKIDKHIPMHLRKKAVKAALQAKPPNVFEILPSSGILLPGQKFNVQVKFMPLEERNYDDKITVKVNQSSSRVVLSCRGSGQEPRIEFEPTLVNLGPILPHSFGDERDVIIRNPCSFPVEIYNLEHDKQYLQDEQILRLVRGWDANSLLLLPPRQAGERLPPELLEYYDEHVKKLNEAERADFEASMYGSQQTAPQSTDNSSSTPMNEDEKEEKKETAQG